MGQPAPCPTSTFWRSRLFTLRSRRRHGGRRLGHEAAEDLDEAVGRRLGAEGLLGETPARPPHGPTLLLVVQELGHLRRDVVTTCGVHDAARTCETRISATELSGGSTPTMGRPEHRYVRTLEGTENREASGSRMATRMSALAMTAGRSP